MASKRRDELPDPERVLAGRSPVRLEQLFDLIHAVNPTDRGLSGSALAAAYALKGRLQSLLIERFGEHVVVTEVEGTSGDVIGLAHRTYDKDACHAVVRQLSAAAQSWIRLQRDLRTTAHETDTELLPVRPPVAADGRGETVPMAQLDEGERLLAAYDFDAAERIFMAVSADSSTPHRTKERIRGGRLLLVLLVEHLAADAVALQRAASFDSEMLADPDVRCLLALAETRLGASDAGAERLGDLVGERADAVATALAAAALAARDLDACERWVARVPAASGSRSAALHLVEEVRSARAEAGRELEQDLANALASGDPERVEPAARRLLAVDPENGTGRAALRQLRTEREAAAIARLVASIRQHLDAGDVVAARAAHRLLPSTAAAHAELAAGIAAAEAAVVEGERERSAVALVQQLECNLDADTVAALWSCEHAVRQRVSERVATPAARWLCLFEVRKSRADQVAAALGAIAVAQAEARLAAGDWVAARAAFAGYEDLARHDPRGRALLERLERAAAAHAADSARDSFAAAIAAADGNPAQALVLLRAVDVRWLAAADREQHARLLERLPGRCEVAAEHDRLSAAVDRDDLFAARAAAARLLRLADAGGRPARAARLAALEQQLRDRWVEAESVGDQELQDLLPLPVLPRACRPAQGMADGIVLAEQRQGRVFLRVVRTAGCNNRTFVLRPPEAFDLLHVHVEGDVVWLTSQQSVLLLDLCTGVPVALSRFRELVGMDAVECALPMPGGRKVWVTTPDGVWLVDRATWSVEQRIDDCQLLCPLWGHDEPRVVYSRHLVDYVRTSDVGRAAWRHRGAYLVRGAVTRPGGSGAAVLRQVWNGDEPASMLRIAALLPEGKGFGEIDLGFVRANAPAEVVASKTADRVFIAAEFVDGGSQLIAVEVGATGVVERSRLSVPGGVRLFADAEARQAHVLIDLGSEVVLRPLSADGLEHLERELGRRLAAAVVAQERVVDFAPAEPAVSSGGRADDRVATAVGRAGGQHRCEWFGRAIAGRVQAFQDLEPLLDAAARARRVCALVDGEPDLATWVALQRSGLLAPREVPPGDGTLPMRLLRAEGHVIRGEPTHALQCLIDCAVDGALPPVLQHAAHLRAVCHLALGQEAEAHDALRLAVVAGSSSCAMERLTDWLAALGSTRAKAPATAADNFLAQVRRGDRDLARGASAAAGAAFDHAALWRQRDTQGMARLAAAWLQLEPENAVAAGRKRRALAEFVAVAAEAGVWNQQRLGAASWSAKRLDELLGQARSWLGPAEMGPTSAGGRRVARRTTLSEPVLALAAADGLLHGEDPVRLLHKRELGTFFDDFVAPLLAQARAQWDRGRKLRMAGLVLAPDWPGAREFGIAARQLLEIEPVAGHIAIAVPMAVALQRLSRWPLAVATLLSRPVLEGPFSRFPLILLRKGQVGFGGITD